MKHGCQRMRSPVVATCFLGAIVGLPFELLGSTVITFEDATRLTPLTTYEESGFVVSAVTGSWEFSHIFIPSTGERSTTELFTGPLFNPSFSDVSSMEIRAADNSVFEFISFDIRSGAGPVDFDVAGLLGGVEVFSISGMQRNCPFDPLCFSTIAGPAHLPSVSALRFTLSPGFPSTIEYSIDNIHVQSRPTDIPEPASGLLVLLGAALVILRRPSSRMPKSTS